MNHIAKAGSGLSETISILQENPFRGHADPPPRDSALARAEQEEAPSPVPVLVPRVSSTFLKQSVQELRTHACAASSAAPTGCTGLLPGLQKIRKLRQ